MNRLTTGLLFAVGCCGAFASDIPSPRPVDVAGFVRQLGSSDFAEREEASRRLATLNVDAPPPELLAALKSTDPEVRDRAGRAVKALREHIALGPERAAISRLPREERFAKRGQINLFVASTAVANYKVDDPRTWEPALEVGRVAIKKAEMTGDRRPNGCPAVLPDFDTYKKHYQPEFTRVGDLYQRESGITAGGTQAPGVSAPLGFVNHIVVSRGPVNTGASQNSLVLATGDVSSGDDIQNSVVICDGDVRVKRNIHTSLIIARGKITIGESAYSSNLIAGATVTIAKPREPAGPEAEKTLYVVVQENAVKPLGFITFFELSTVGVEAKVVGKSVRVTSVADGKAFAAAGVKVGDIVTDVNGKKPDSPESLRRLLRDALALGDATVKLQRGDKTETVKIALPE